METRDGALADEIPVPVPDGADGARIADLLQLAREAASRGDVQGTATYYDRVLDLDSENAVALRRLAEMALQLGDTSAAIDLVTQSIEAHPEDAESYRSRGLILLATGCFAQSGEDFERAIALEPGSSKAHLGAGVSSLRLAQYESALAHLTRAVELDPGDAEALFYRAGVHTARGDNVSALEDLRLAAELTPGHAPVHFELGNTLVRLKRFPGALTSFRKARSLQPDLPSLVGAMSYAGASLCDWQSREQELLDLEKEVEARPSAARPFVLVALFDRPDLHLKSARAWSDAVVDSVGRAAVLEARPGSTKLRLGYFSRDICEHPVSHLLVELLEKHDRDRFEVQLFSWAPEVRSDIARRVLAAADKVVDIRSMPDLEAARAARSESIDVAIDLMAHTQGGRPGIFAARAAPIQVNFLGYPGSSGSVFMDYLIADKIVISDASRPFITEKIAFLPDCYQPNDSKRQVAGWRPKRTEVGLPEKGIVFCCFNSSFKINPATFDLWIEILRHVEGSRLWLLDDVPEARANLARECEARGAAAGRIVYASRVPHDRHLARLPLADLVLDTAPYNAHTTASDALWMGVPIVTLPGASFACRVAASILHAAKLPQLVAASTQDYVRIAVDLAHDGMARNSIRDGLLASRSRLPLFDSERFARNIERAYLTMANRNRAGLPAEDFVV